jgi:hypothetical protein
LIILIISIIGLGIYILKKKERGTKILILVVVLCALAIMGFVAVKLAPGLFGSREVKFESEETPSVAPVAPKENSIGSQLVPGTQENVKMFFSNGEDEEKDEAVSKAINLKLRITDTPTGWLNVRDDSALDGKAITKVYPGEEYEYTDEQNGWYQIVLSDGKHGWIFGKFAEVLGE